MKKTKHSVRCRYALSRCLPIVAAAFAACTGLAHATNAANPFQAILHVVVSGPGDPMHIVMANTSLLGRCRCRGFRRREAAAARVWPFRISGRSKIQHSILALDDQNLHLGRELHGALEERRCDATATSWRKNPVSDTDAVLNVSIDFVAYESGAFESTVRPCVIARAVLVQMSQGSHDTLYDKKFLDEQSDHHCMAPSSISRSRSEICHAPATTP